MFEYVGRKYDVEGVIGNRGDFGGIVDDGLAEPVAGESGAAQQNFEPCHVVPGLFQLPGAVTPGTAEIEHPAGFPERPQYADTVRHIVVAGSRKAGVDQVLQCRAVRCLCRRVAKIILLIVVPEHFRLRLGPTETQAAGRARAELDNEPFPAGQFGFRGVAKWAGAALSRQAPTEHPAEVV